MATTKTGTPPPAALVPREDPPAAVRGGKVALLLKEVGPYAAALYLRRLWTRA